MTTARLFAHVKIFIFVGFRTIISVELCQVAVQVKFGKYCFKERDTRVVGLERRNFLKTAGALAAASIVSSQSASGAATAEKSASGKMLKPNRLHKGDTVAIVAPSGIMWDNFDVQLATESLNALGLKAKIFPHARDRYGYLAGTDENRAKDLMAAFLDPEVKGIFCLRGGWGAARILDFLDFKAIEANPKILIGYSDITALHTAIAAKTNMVSFLGPNAGSSWRIYEADIVRDMLFAAKKVEIKSLVKNNGTLVPRINRPRTLSGGVAEGRLSGGNLTVFSSLVGTEYFPDLSGTILCLEDIGEKIYRIDRMLTQLSLAGHLKNLKGVALGGFTDCGPDENEPYGGFLIDEVFEHHFGNLGIPVFRGAQFGHIPDNATLPIGAKARMDANAGTISLVEASVV